MEPSHYVGLDVSQELTSVCVVDEQGAVVWRGKCATDPDAYAWRELVALRLAQALPRAEQPVLFELHEDRRPPGERTAAERYCEPSLFTLMERLD